MRGFTIKPLSNGEAGGWWAGGEERGWEEEFRHREAGSEGANPPVKDDVVRRVEDTMTMNYDNDH
jgi:hypothetical protein